MTRPYKEKSDKEKKKEKKSTKPKKKIRLSTIFLVLLFLTGLSLLLYPSFSNYWNSFHQTRAIAAYTEAVANLDEEDYERILADARAYNEWLYESGHGLGITDGEREDYNALLDVAGNGIMGYIEIPSIQCTLPIYHGTDESVLQIAVGHIEGSSLPVGGENTHCVLSGHRGLPSAELFSNLDELTEGDLFMIQTLDETLTYEVDQILIVLPQEIDSLRIEEGKDLCTLVTCTPYGINSHRILARGHRVPNQDDGSRVTADATQIAPVLVAPAVAVPMLFILLIVLLINTRKKKARGMAEFAFKGDYLKEES